MFEVLASLLIHFRSLLEFTLSWSVSCRWIRSQRVPDWLFVP